MSVPPERALLPGAAVPPISDASRARLAALAARSDDEIEAAARSDPDNPPLGVGVLARALSVRGSGRERDDFDSTRR